MAGKITLYVRDDDLWTRARETAGRGGLSALVDQCLREHLAGTARESASPPSVLEQARRLRHDAETLVRTLELQPPRRRARSRAHRSSTDH